MVICVNDSRGYSPDNAMAESENQESCIQSIKAFETNFALLCQTNLAFNAITTEQQWQLQMQTTLSPSVSKRQVSTPSTEPTMPTT
jgi:hypothetical protein